MKLVNLSALSLLLFVLVFSISSCEKDAEKKKITEFSKTGIAITGANEIPTVSSAATGTLDVFYTRETRILSYKVNWTGLADSVAGMHIHGEAPVGFNAAILQNIVGASNSVFPQKTSGKFTFAKNGSLSGTVLMDGVLFKEQSLLNGLYYLNIHNATYSGGEIRAQVTFD